MIALLALTFALLRAADPPVAFTMPLEFSCSVTVTGGAGDGAFAGKLEARGTVFQTGRAKRYELTIEKGACLFGAGPLVFLFDDQDQERTCKVLNPLAKVAQRVPARGVPLPPVPTAQMAWKKSGTEAIGAATCTRYEVSGGDEPITAWVNPANVLVRYMTNGKKTLVDVTAFTAGPQDPGKFIVPKEYVGTDNGISNKPTNPNGPPSSPNPNGPSSASNPNGPPSASNPNGPPSASNPKGPPSAPNPAPQGGGGAGPSSPAPAPTK